MTDATGPAGRSPRLGKDDRVFHAAHGPGTVLVVNIRSVMVEFDRSGTFVVMPEELEAGSAAEAPDAAEWTRALSVLRGATEAEMAALGDLFMGPPERRAERVARLDGLAARTVAARRTIEALRRGAGA